MHNELITYDMLKASLNYAKIGFSDAYCEITNTYRIGLIGLEDVFVFVFNEDGSFNTAEDR